LLAARFGVVAEVFFGAFFVAVFVLFFAVVFTVAIGPS
jgi:hypothetical protein